MRMNCPIGRKSNRWYRIALRTVLREIDAGRAACETTAQIRKRVVAAYPFGERAMWPYVEVRNDDALSTALRARRAWKLSATARSPSARPRRGGCSGGR